MKQSIFEILKNEPLTKDVFRMVLAGDTSAITASGQFVNIQMDAKLENFPMLFLLKSNLMIREVLQKQKYLKLRFL